MKKYLLFLLLNPYLVFGQNTVNDTMEKYPIVTPIVGLEFQFTVYRDMDLILLNNYSISGGVQVFQKLDVMINTGFLNTQHLIDGQNQKINAVPFSTSFQYRFFKKYWISPSLRCDIGGMLWSNIKDKFVNERLEIEPLAYGNHDYNRIFKKWGPLFSTQLILSFKIKQLYIDLGIGYSLLNFKTTDFMGYTKKSNTASGVNVHTGIKYAFPLKKKQLR